MPFLLKLLSPLPSPTLLIKNNKNKGGRVQTLAEDRWGRLVLIGDWTRYLCPHVSYSNVSHLSSVAFDTVLYY